MIPERPMKRGDRYHFADGGGKLTIDVMRVARDGSWADIRVSGEYSEWTKRQRLQPDGSFPFAVKEESRHG